MSTVDHYDGETYHGPNPKIPFTTAFEPRQTLPDLVSIDGLLPGFGVCPVCEKFVRLASLEFPYISVKDQRLTGKCCSECLDEASGISDKLATSMLEGRYLPIWEYALQLAAEKSECFMKSGHKLRLSKVPGCQHCNAKHGIKFSFNSGRDAIPKTTLICENCYGFSEKRNEIFPEYVQKHVNLMLSCYNESKELVCNMHLDVESIEEPRKCPKCKRMACHVAKLPYSNFKGKAREMLICYHCEKQEPTIQDKIGYNLLQDDGYFPNIEEITEIIQFGSCTLVHPNIKDGKFYINGEGKDYGLGFCDICRGIASFRAETIHANMGCSTEVAYCLKCYKKTCNKKEILRRLRFE